MHAECDVLSIPLVCLSMPLTVLVPECTHSDILVGASFKFFLAPPPLQNPSRNLLALPLNTEGLARFAIFDRYEIGP